MSKNKRIIVATHGELAEGFKKALAIIVGERQDLETVCCYTEADFDLTKTIDAIMTSTDFTDTDLIVCTDMMGGSVNNGFVTYLGRYPFYLVTNTNLSFLVDLLLWPDDVDAEVLRAKTSDGLVSVTFVNEMQTATEDDDL